MFVSELQNSPKPLRLYYFGNCFRYERPQKGRFREFWQLGAELIGGARPDSEAEAIALADQLIRSAGIRGDIHIGYLGLIRAILERIEGDKRAAAMRMIDKKERSALKELLEDLDQGDLGLLELIDLKGKAALDKAQEIAGDLLLIEPQEAFAGSGGSKACSEPNMQSEGRGSARNGRAVSSQLHLEEFQETVDLLGAYGVDFQIDFEIVRGLDYYSGTVFEIYAEGLGAQRQICGGGTYELSSLFGGKETSSTGFGLGFDRIMEIAHIKEERKPPVFLVYTPDVKADAARIAVSLRMSVPAVLDVMGRSMGAQLKAASVAGARHAVIVGRDELDSGRLILRDMSGGEQENLTLEEIVERLRPIYSSKI